MVNENAISNILIDIDFLEEEFRRHGRPDLATAFVELRAVSNLFIAFARFASHVYQTAGIVMTDTVQEYLVPSMRQAAYGNVKPKRLQALLEKLARYGSQCRDSPSRDRGEKRRKEAEAVGRVFPGENR